MKPEDISKIELKDTDGYLQRIQNRLESLSNHIIRPFPDNRIATPDETCTFFQLSGGVGAAGVDRLLTFKVPDSQRGVIAELQTRIATEPSGAAKNEGRLVIVRNITSDQLNAANDVCISLYGSLNNVFEGQNTTQLNMPGICAPPGWVRNTFRIPLEPGQTYSFYRDGGTINAVRCSCWIFGWTFPYQPQKP